jgi:hypothetical protein
VQPAAPSPIARLPLQIGVAAAWGIARAGVSLFPGLVWTGAWLSAALPLALSAVWEPAAWRVALAVLGGFPLAHAAFNLRAALRTRASDLHVYPEGVAVDGGPHHGRYVPYAELTRPYVEVEETTESRLSVIRMVTFFLPGVRTVSREVEVTRLSLFHKGTRLVVGESDRAIEADSFTAARATIEAVAEGRRHVEEAPAVSARVITCGTCGAAVIPEDAPSVACRYCRAPVALDEEVRGQAAAALAMEQSQKTGAKIVAKLLAQQPAARSNAWLFVYALFMLGVWPLGFWLIATRTGHGFAAVAPLDILFMAMPLAAVFGGFFLTRAMLADRGALRLLTLGYGALAPRREGEPPRCRCCQGPLVEGSVGSVALCRYCQAENIVGVDLRPTVDRARAEHKSLGPALTRRARERGLWALGCGLAVALLALWGSLSYAYASDALDVPAWAMSWPWQGAVGASGKAASWPVPFGYTALDGCNCGAASSGGLSVKEGLVDALTQSKGERRLSYAWQNGDKTTALALAPHTVPSLEPGAKGYAVACEGNRMVIVGDKAATAWSLVNGGEKWTTSLGGERSAARGAGTAARPLCEPLILKKGQVTVPLRTGRSVSIRVSDGRIVN